MHWRCDHAHDKLHVLHPPTQRSLRRRRVRDAGLNAGTLERAAVRNVALAALALGGCAIAFAPIFVRVSETGPTASAFWRVALAVPFLGIWTLLTARPAVTRNAFSWPLAVAGLAFAGDLAVWHLSILYTSVANATLLANLAPLFVTVGGFLLFRERVTRLFLAGMTLALAGAFVLVGPSFALGRSALAGDALGVLTALFYGVYFLAIKQLRDSRDTAHIMAMSTVISALALAPIALLSGEPLLPATADGWLVLLGLALVCQTVGQGLIAFAMAHLPASLSAVSLLIQPVMATCYAWWLLGERVSALQLAGGVIVLAGIYLARRGSLAPGL
jgi:drug/metabolite transporter (DMT)-like permease